MLTLVAVLGSTVPLAVPPAHEHADAAAVAPEVVVSLTWDDGRADQIGSLAIQQRYGFPATYYINSAMIGSSGYYLSRPQLDQIAAAGNEIGGHTERHSDLTALSPAAATTAVCADRQRLMNWYGPEAGRSFAYPYGAVHPTAQSIVQGCGYETGRGVGGIRQIASCASCPLAESVPPASPYRLGTVSSVLDGTPLADLQRSVALAEQAGGGWVVYVLHSLGTGGDGYGVDPGRYDDLLAWLAAKPNVTVKTVADAMEGPPVPGPIDLSQNLLANPGLEADADGDGVADCWQRTGYGTNAYQWTRTTGGHGGSMAEQVVVTSYASGDRKLVTRQDSGACAPAVQGGKAYRMGVWYESTAPAQIVVFYRDGGGAWRYWRTGPVLAPAATWTWATLAPGELPADARALSFGVALTGTGTLRTDDHVLVPTSVPSPDTTPPTVALVQPADQATVTGTVEVRAEASDDTAVSAVEFRVGTTLVGSDSTPPYSFQWDSTTAPDGPTTVSAVARDAAGNSATDSRHVEVANGAPGGSLVPNPSLEARQASGTPSCWVRTGYGTNTSTWSAVPEARTGTSAERLDLLTRTTGDRKLLIRLDAGQAAGGCAPDVRPGQVLDLSAWYRSTVPTGIVVYYRDQQGVWAWWRSSWMLPASDRWAPATYTTPPMPADATAVSFGLYLSTPGTLWTDDYGIQPRS